MERSLRLKAKMCSFTKLCDYLDESYDELNENIYTQKILSKTIKLIAKEARLIEREYSDIYDLK